MRQKTALNISQTMPAKTVIFSMFRKFSLLETYIYYLKARVPPYTTKEVSIQYAGWAGMSEIWASYKNCVLDYILISPRKISWINFSSIICWLVRDDIKISGNSLSLQCKDRGGRRSVADSLVKIFMKNASYHWINDWKTLPLLFRYLFTIFLDHSYMMVFSGIKYIH